MTKREGIYASHRKSLISALATGALLIFWQCLALRSAFIHSPSFDETGHLAAGLSHWQLQRFELYAVNPPLVRSLATSVLQCWNLELDWSSYSTNINYRSEFIIGRRFFELNKSHGMRALAFARCNLVACWTGIILAVFAFRRVRDSPLSLPALATAAVSPSLLAHGAMITPDFGGMLLGFVAWLFIETWRKAPRTANVVAMGIALGFAILAKTTNLIFGIVFLICLGFLNGARGTRTNGWRILRDGFIVIAVTIHTINTGYLFTGCCTRIGDLSFVSSKLTSSHPSHLNRFSRTFAAGVPIPLPESFLLGLDAQFEDFETGAPSYLCGEWKHGGWWYYYLVGFLVKEPIGFQLMLYASIVHGLWNWKQWTKQSFHEWSLVVLPPVLIFGLVSSQTGFNHHMRYVLPAYPFLFIIAARTVTLGKFWKWFSYACLTWQAAAVLWFAPHWMSYFNELAGGPKNGHEWLVDSNIDWGQDVLMLKWWQDKHPEATDLQAALYTSFDPKDIGLKFRLPAPYIREEPQTVSELELRGPQPGWYAISVCQLKGHSSSVPEGDGAWSPSDGHFTYFMDHFEPVDRIGYSIYIYHISEDDATRVRAKLLAEEELQFLKAAGGEK